MISKNQLLYFLFVFFCSFFLFYPSLFYYFFQDDWFVLNWANTGNLLSFFQFRTDIIYWRPLTMPIFFALGNLMFNLNPIGFHLIVFAFHFFNSFLVYKLFRQLKLSETAGKFSAFIYAVSAFHFIGLSWLSTSSYIIGAAFILLSIINFLKLKHISSFIFFLLALASTELAIVIIPLIFISAKNLKATTKNLLPFAAVLFFYFPIRLLIFPIPALGDYSVSLNLKILTNISWYLLWTFNFAEKFSTIFFVSNIKDFPGLILSHLNALIFPIILICTSAVYVLVSKLNIRYILFGLCWFLISLSPVILIPKHVYPAYLAIASLGIFFILAKTLDSYRKYKLLLAIGISCLWLLSSAFTLDFTRKTHWIANQQSISLAYSNYLKSKVSNPLDNSLFVIKPADIYFSRDHNFTLVETEQNVKQSFNDQDAVQVLYKNLTLKSIFPTHQDIIDLPQDIRIYWISPRIEK